MFYNIGPWASLRHSCQESTLILIFTLAIVVAKLIVMLQNVSGILSATWQQK
jgi:hypothetical protein